MSDKLQVIFDMLIDGVELTDENLLNQGVTAENIEELVVKKYLITNDDRTYQYNKDRVKKFFQYYKKLVKAQEEIRAKRCLDVCWQLNPYEREVCIKKIIEDLDTPTENTDGSKIHKAFARFLKYLYTSENKSEVHKRDDNLYLFLFSLIIEVPEIYINEDTQTLYGLREIATSMKYKEDIQLEKTNETKPENFIRKQIFLKKMTYACQLISERNAKELFSLKYHLLLKLTSRATFTTKKIKEDILYYIRQDNFEKALEILQNDFNLRPQRIYEEIILILLLKIVELRKTNIIPEKIAELSKTKTTNSVARLLDAIRRNDFEQALEINRSDTEAIGILLTKILEIIDKIKNSQIEEIHELEEQNEELKRVLDEAKDWYSMVVQYAKDNFKTIEESLKNISLISESRLLVRLYAALECYKECDLTEGDKYLKIVEEDKTISTLKTQLLLNYVKLVKVACEKKFKTKEKSLKTSINQE